MDKYSSFIWYAADDGGGGGGGGALSNIILEPDALNYRFMAETVFVHKSRNVHVVTILPGTIWCHSIMTIMLVQDQHCNWSVMLPEQSVSISQKLANAIKN